MDNRELKRLLRLYKHMSPHEIPIWHKAQALPQFSGWLFEYDVRVGEGLVMPEGTLAAAQALAKSLTQKRIDVLCDRPESLHIFEVKLNAGLSGIGQLFGYQTLYRDTYNYSGPINLWYVTDRFQSDIQQVAAASQIATLEVGIE